MNKGFISKRSLAFSLGLLLIALLGATLLTPKVRHWLALSTGLHLNYQVFSQKEYYDNESVILTLASVSPQKRRAKLEEIASSSDPLERSRARYLLASDLIAEYEGGPAILQLEKLEYNYPILAPQILLKRGRAYQLTNDNDKAVKIWQQVLKKYPDTPVAAQALYLLGKLDREYQDRAIAKFPYHPLTQDLIRQRLQENPQQLELMMLLAKYSPKYPGMNQIRDRIIQEYDRQLTPKDWEIIADGYWLVGEYGKASLAYAKAPNTPQNLYRTARGMHLTGEKGKARGLYHKLLKAFPQEEITSLGLKHLASLSSNREALNYLELIIKRFPDTAPQALLEKAKLLDNLGNAKAASQTRQLLLEKYPNSEASAEYRWRLAQKFAARGNFAKAWEWIQPITNNKKINSNIAAKAGFWMGKWATRLNRSEDAKTAYQYVLANHPQSYYAWRSAVMLGLDLNVGDFTTVRKLTPEVIKIQVRNVPPAGSDSFKELYRLGQDRDAWNLFQAEVKAKDEFTVAEQFTEGLLLQTQGKNLLGMSRIWTLQHRTTAAEKAEWQELRKTPEYWQALFPFPFEDSILKWSKKHQLNPLLVTALIRQESRFEPKITSPVGALGLMQVMPATGQWIASKINVKEYSLTNPEDNLNFGTWYLNHTHQVYNNNSVLAIASYNAGPGNVEKWVKTYDLNDLDTFVEKIPFPETRGYVESVLGNYWNYLRIYGKTEYNFASLIFR